MSGNVTVVGQATGDDAIRKEVVSSFDLFVEVGIGQVLLHTYVEANTTPFSGGVSGLLPGANADAGTALNGRGTGRLQISELRLVLPAGEDLRAHVGLLDATGFIDVSRIANDENLFFLSVPFVNNPTIRFPDYTLGVALEGAFPGSVPLTLGAVVTRSRGVADDPCACYRPLFELDGDSDGAFVGTALRWERGNERVSLGGWIDTSERVRLDGSGGVGTARGLFGVLGHRTGDHSVSLRGGLGDGSVSAEQGFVGLTYLLALSPNALGLAFGRTFVSDALASADDVDRGEAFLRRRIVGDVFVTASVQRVAHGGSPPSPAIASTQWIAGIRLSAQF